MKYATAHAIKAPIPAMNGFWDRIAHTIAAPDAKLMEEQLSDLRAAADDEDMSAARQSARDSRRTS